MYRLISGLVVETETWERLLLYLGFILLVLLVYQLLYLVLKKWVKKSEISFAKILETHFYRPFQYVVLVASLASVYMFRLKGWNEFLIVYNHIIRILFVIALAYFIIKLIKGTRSIVLSQFDLDGGTEESKKGRKIYTQLKLVESILVFFVVICAVAAILMTFEGVRKVGISLLASAGIFGVILGFSAQKLIGTVLSGIQIAWAQPVRIGDVVVISGHWGKVEEITLTHITLKIWDNRQLVVPINWIIENPFENWTKLNSELNGSVFIYVDYSMPIEPMREELTRIVNSSKFWDGRKQELLVTNLTDKAMEIRALASAKDADDAFDLRCEIREKLITYVQKNYPASLPFLRVELNK